MNKTFPEINGLNLKDARLALRMAVNNYDSVTPEAQADLRLRMNALEARIERLVRTQAKINRENLALSLKGGR